MEFCSVTITMSTISDFTTGFSYAIKGIDIYVSRPRLWLYAIIPSCFVCAIYVACATYLFAEAMPQLTDYISSLCDSTWFSWAAHVINAFAWLLSVLTFLLMLALLLGTLFECIGGPFFTAMVRYFEHHHYNTQEPKLTFADDAINTIHSIIYSLGTCLMTILLYLATWFLPFIAQLLVTLLVSYRYGIIYCMEPAFNRHWRIRDIPRQFREHKAVILGFGTAIFLLLLIPFVSLLLLPTFYISGAILINEHLKGTTQLTSKVNLQKLDE